MMRINRRIRQRTGKLTQKQREWLAFGPMLGTMLVNPFASEAQERRAWQRHRDRLLAEPMQPGQRCYAYFQLDLELRDEELPRRWRDMIRILRARNLMSETEEAELERISNGRFQKQ